MLDKIYNASNEHIIIIIGIFWAILFLQSGLDKVFDYKGNLSWVKEHFAKSILAPMTTPMFITLTILELAAGIICGLGVILFLTSGDKSTLLFGLLLSAISLLMLFFGQRVAKDYDGAKTIAIYFGVALISFLFII